MKRTTSLPMPAPVMVAVSLLLLGPAALTLAQHALDAGLRIGSNGYRVTHNAPSRMQSTRYSPGSSRAVYTVSRRTGAMRYNPHTAFSPRSRYQPTGYHGSQRFSTRHSRRFRYSGYNYR